VFGVVAAAEVHPQPQLLMFGKVRKSVFSSWDPLCNCGVPQVSKKQPGAASCKE